MSQSKKRIDKRDYSWKNTFPGLMSERVRIIMSNPQDASSLMDAVRRIRNNQNATFEVSEITQKRLDSA